MPRHVPMPDGSPCWCAMCEAERRVEAAETEEERAFWDRYERGWARASGDTGKSPVGEPAPTSGDTDASAPQYQSKPATSGPRLQTGVSGSGVLQSATDNPYTPHGGSWSEGILERSWEAEQEEEERQRKR